MGRRRTCQACTSQGSTLKPRRGHMTAQRDLPGSYVVVVPCKHCRPEAYQLFTRHYPLVNPWS